MNDGKNQMSREKLAQELNSPEARRKRTEARTAERRAAFGPIKKQLLEVGVECDTVDGLIDKYAPLHSGIVEILVRAISDIKHETILDMVLRALILAENKFDCKPIVQLFNNTQSPNIRFSAANTLLSLRKFGVEKEVLADARRVVYKK